MATKSNGETANPNLVYEMVTDQIVRKLEQGTAPWRQPWRAASEAPRNIDGYRYHGVNVFILLSQGYGSPYWLTFKQAHERGGHVRKGEHGTVIVFWKQLRVRDTEASATSGRDEYKTIPMLRYYRVWNVEQCDDVRLPKNAIASRPQDPTETEAIAAAAAIIEGMPNRPAIGHGGDRAYYRPATDQVQLPSPGAFCDPSHYYSTAFHELGHATGHASRLARPGITELDEFGSYQYGREELVAEMTAAFLSAEAGILPTTINESASYLASWVRTLKQDVRAVVVAAGAAQRAANYILDRTEPAREVAAEAA